MHLILVVEDSGAAGGPRDELPLVAQRVEPAGVAAAAAIQGDGGPHGDGLVEPAVRYRLLEVELELVQVDVELPVAVVGIDDAVAVDVVEVLAAGAAGDVEDEIRGEVPETNVAGRTD